MRLTGPVDTGSNPQEWIANHQVHGYTAIFVAPFSPEDPRQDEYLAYAKKQGYPLAECGAWSNPINPDPVKAREAVEHCIRALALSEKLGARCCVNIAGSRSDQWDGPHPTNLDDDIFDLIVTTVQKIIDAVKPTRTIYGLETMPWIFPDSPDSYLRLIKAIDRKGFGVHLDPVNMINCPARAYRTGDFLRECFAKLGPKIVACHAKDITLGNWLTVHLAEALPGTGLLDYHTYVRELKKLDPDITVGIEHLETPEQYAAAARYIRGVMKEEGME